MTKRKEKQGPEERTLANGWQREASARVPKSENELPVPLLDDALRRWIKVIKPARASLVYERME